MYNIYHLDGIDKTGKSTFKKYIVKRDYTDLVYDRSIISQVTYARIKGLSLSIDFYTEQYKKLVELGHTFVFMFCSFEVFKNRHIEHDEKDIKIDDYYHHYQQFMNTLIYFNDIHPIIKIDTTDISLDECYRKLKKLKV